MAAPGIDGYLTRVSPKRTLARTALLSFVFLSVPLFGALYLLGVPRGTWAPVLAAQLLSILLVTVALLLYRSTFVGVTPDHVIERRLLGRLVRIPRSQLATPVLVRTYRTNAPDTSPQLLVTNSIGSRTLRMRGLFWSEKSMRLVAAALGHPLESVPDPMTTREYFTAFPASAYWFERRSLAVTGVLFVLVVSLAAVIGLMALVGIPISLGG